MIYVDQHAEPQDIARTLWRELGPEACITIALMIAVREEERRLLVLDLSGLEDIDESKN
jgi:hypothetical protein